MTATTPLINAPRRTEEEYRAGVPREECAEARAMTIASHLAELWEYFDNRMDADCVDGQFVGNEEMRLLGLVEELMKLTEARNV